jgi:hypothetical protein
MGLGAMVEPEEPPVAAKTELEEQEPEEPPVAAKTEDPEEPPVAARTELRGCEAAKAVKQEPPTSRQGRGRGAAKAVKQEPEDEGSAPAASQQGVFGAPFFQYSFHEMHEFILIAAAAPNATEVPSTRLRS